MAVKPGWTGRVFEDFEVGDVYEHPLGRTILDADNIWFTCLTMNANPIHFDGEYAAQTEFGKRLVNSCLTLALVTGQSVRCARSCRRRGWTASRRRSGRCRRSVSTPTRFSASSGSIATRLPRGGAKE